MQAACRASATDSPAIILVPYGYGRCGVAVPEKYRELHITEY